MVYFLKLAGQEINVKKLCRKENIANHGEDNSGFNLGSLLYLPVFKFMDLPLVMSDVHPV